MNQNDPRPDENFDPDELDAAVNDRPPANPAPELEARTEFVTTWDDSPASHGHSAPKTEPDDEQEISAELVDEGLEEADTEQRIASADPDSE